MASKYTILMVTNNYIPYSGGVVSSIQSLTSEMRNRGHTVVIVTFAFQKDSSDEMYVEKIACFARFWYKKNIIPIPMRSRSQMRTIFERWKPDIVHVHHPFGLGAVALSIARSLGLPVIFTHHTLYAEYAHYIPLPSYLLKPLIKNIVTRFCQKVDHIIAPTVSVKAYIRQQAIHTPISVIASSIAPLFLASTCPVKTSLIDRPLRLLTVSRFVPEKNIHVLLSVFYVFQKIFTESQLKLIGYGSLLDALRQYAYKQLCFSPDRVTFVEKPSKSELVKAYSEADLFVFASRSETQGIVLAEAFSQGTPVIAFEGCGVSDVVTNGVNGFLVKTEEEMVERLVFLSKHSERLQELQYAAFTTSKKYHPKRIAQEVESLYARYAHF